MKQTELIMGMPITIWLPRHAKNTQSILQKAFDFFRYSDALFSTYKPTSEISKINRGALKPAQASRDVRAVLALCQNMTKQTHGYFSIEHAGKIDPSGLVKGWTIKHVGELLDGLRVQDYAIDAAGDVLVKGVGPNKQVWTLGIRMPDEPDRIAKQLRLSNCAIATSGTYERGNHIYNPHTGKPATDLRSVTIIGPDICLADVYATTLFAMGKDYQTLLDTTLPFGYEAYVINHDLTATFTPGFEKYML